MVGASALRSRFTTAEGFQGSQHNNKDILLISEGWWAAGQAMPRLSIHGSKRPEHSIPSSLLPHFPQLLMFRVDVSPQQLTHSLSDISSFPLSLGFNPEVERSVDFS